MSRWRQSLTVPPELRDADPSLLTPFDPYAGDEAVMLSADYADYAHHAPLPPDRLSPDAHAALDAAFCEQYRRILDGQAPWRSARPLAAALLLDAPARSDSRPLHQALRPISDAVLAAMGEDQVPDIGVLAPDRVLGPFSEESLPRLLWQLTGAVMAFAPILQKGVAPVARVIHQKPRPPTDISSPVRAVARTPPMLWQRTPAGGLAPVLQLGSRMCPVGAPSRPLPAVGTVLLGRAVLLEDGGWWLACALPLPGLPDPAVLERRLRLELWRVRRHDRRLTWEDLLRERGEVLYRAACEACWWSWRAETLALWRVWAAAG